MANKMNSLQVQSGIWTLARQKAAQDAERMQAAVRDACAKLGKEVPPYQLSELIGKGSFGRVYKGTSLKGGQVVAVKIIDVDESDTVNPKLADTYSEFLKEINALQVLREAGAENINVILEALPVGKTMWMVTEYCAGGSVATLMKPTAPGGLQEKWIIPILREVAVAISWVHKYGIIHRDIKCANVLVTETGGVQLCDFGVAGMMESKFDKRSTFIGTPHWMAPELFDPNAKYGTEVDIWAFGSMVYEIASGLPPNVGANVGLPQFGGFLREHIPRLEGTQYSQELKSLVAFCLVESPEKRPTIQKVQDHPYLHNTSARYPTSSLASLVRAYKLWEERGGTRKSLFNPNIGAQAPGELSSTAMAADEWNFSTTLAFDEQIHENSDGLTDVDAVRDVYGSEVDFPSMENTARPKPKGRRRPPPQALAAMKAPLEKVFDPNTISSYVENSQAYYGRAPPPPPPPPAPASDRLDLPLRDDSQDPTVRESLIDLDASLDGGDLSSFTDMDTIRALPAPAPAPGPAPRPGPRASMDNGWSFSNATDPNYQQAPLSDPVDLSSGSGIGPDWQWPTSIPSVSAAPENGNFPFPDDVSGPQRPRLVHHPTEPVGLPSQGYNNELQAPRTINDRMSVQSLIDLDEGLVEPSLPELTRPSTANSDMGSVSGSELGGGGPFDLERHTSVYAPLPLTNREPSIYVSDDSEFATNLAKATSNLEPIPDLETNTTSSLSTAGTIIADPQSTLGSSISFRRSPTPNQQQLQAQHGRTPSGGSDTLFENTLEFPLRGSSLEPEPELNGTFGNSGIGGLQLPYVPPPSLGVMEGRASSRDVANEMRRLIASLSEHLTIVGNQVAGMEPRRAATAAGGGTAAGHTSEGEVEGLGVDEGSS